MGRKICNSNTGGKNFSLIFIKTELEGAYIVELEKIEDERGFFSRSWDKKKFQELNLNPSLVQCNVSFNKLKGTLRGMHFQAQPYEEARLVRCTRGSIFDVIIDLRKKSNTFKRWLGIELSEHNYNMLYVPEGFAHGFQTLEDNTEVFYQMSEEYMPEYTRGVKWNDESFQIKWPIKPTVVSQKDMSYTAFNAK